MESRVHRPGDDYGWLSVSIDGTKYDDRPIGGLIEGETSRPLLLTRYRGKVAWPDMVTSALDA